MKDQEQQPMHKRPASQDDDRDPTVSRLLLHLKEMRESVPVNYQLKQELKKKLLAQMVQMGCQSANPDPANSVAKRKNGWLSLLLGLAILLSGVAYWEMRSQVQISDWQSMTAIEGIRILDADLSTLQNQAVYLSENTLLFYNEQGQKIQSISLPGQEGKIIGMAASPMGDEVAWMKKGSQSNEIWISQVMGGGSRLVMETPFLSFHGMIWSLDGKWLYASFGEEIWKISTFSHESSVIAKGTNPALSPNGSYLVIVHDNQMEVWDAIGKPITKLGYGQSPVWIDDERVLFVDEQSRVMICHPFEEKENRESVSAMKRSEGTPLIRLSADRKRIMMGDMAENGGKVWIGHLNIR